MTISTSWEVGSSFGTAHVLGPLTGSQIVSSAIEPQVYELAFPGSSDEPGHRDIREEVEAHLTAKGDAVSGISTLYYNFRDDYGADPDGNVLSNLITPEQKERTREILEIYGQYLGLQFVETGTQGFTIATGDLRALDPESDTGPGGFSSMAGTSLRNQQPTLVVDNAETWNDAFGPSDDPLRSSWFEAAIPGIGHLLGLGDTYDLPPGTTMGEEPSLAFDNVSEPIYPGDQDIVHGRHLYRTEGKDIDLYQFQIEESGLFTAETFAERQAESSLLDSVVSLYREQNGEHELIARNDDYFSGDSYLELDLESGVYYIGVSAAGNEDYDPVIEDSGIGGLSEGVYDLRLTFRPEANSVLDVDNSQNDEAGEVSRATALDGDGDGVPGGVYNFWFRVDREPIIVDKAAPDGGNGTLLFPFNNIAWVFDARNPNGARTDDVVRIIGNGGADNNLATPEDALPYEIGFDAQGRPLGDGSTMEIPQGVTVMIDRGAVFKLRRARIEAGSSGVLEDRSGGALQVLGTPRIVDLGGNLARDANGSVLPGSVYFTSYHDESLGSDSTLATSTTPNSGDWGGLAFQGDSDSEEKGIFLNYVNNADIRFGGGIVVIGGVPQTVNPIYLTDARPTVTFSSITQNADSAVSASPDSFEETNFHTSQYQSTPFTSDYTRIGPDIHGNRIVDNSINGMLIRTETPPGGELEEMTVSGRWDDTDIVHVLAETLRVHGSPGGPIQTLDAPQANLVGLSTVERPTPSTGSIFLFASSGGSLAAGSYTYRITFVDADGNESLPSSPTSPVEVDGSESVRLNNLPLPVAPYDASRRLYRSTLADAAGNGSYELAAVLNASDTIYVDDGTTIGDLLDVSVLAAGIHNYRIVFVDAAGNEGPASDATSDILIGLTGATESAVLTNLPVAPSPFTGRRIYRAVKSDYVLVDELDGETETYVDSGATLGGLLNSPALWLDSRLHGRLAIDPGTIVKLNGAGIETSFGSQLIAEGLDGNEVVFTSLFDDRYGAVGTFETSDQGTVEPGTWSGIYVGHMSRASIDHAVLAYGGGVSEVPGRFSFFNALEIHQADARVAHSVFENNANGTGGQAPAYREGRNSNAEAVIFVRGAQPIIVDNILIDNAGPAISADVNALNHELVTDHGRSTGFADAQDHIVDNQGPLIRGNRLANNDINGMRVRAGTLTTEGVWDDTDIVHVVQEETIHVSDFHTYGGLRLESDPYESLVVKLGSRKDLLLNSSIDIVDAGITVNGRPLDITDRVGGMLHIIGQPGSPVVLTSLRDDSVGAGFRPDGTPQTDTNNDGEPVLDDTLPQFPTGPQVDNGIRIDNNVPTDTVGHFEFEPLPGGSADILQWTPPANVGPYGPFGPDGVTPQGLNRWWVNDSFIFQFLNYIDVGADGDALELGAMSTSVMGPTFNPAVPDEVTSQGTFVGTGGNSINWTARSYFDSGVARLFNEITFESSEAFGPIQFINYLDEDVGGFADNMLYLQGSPGDPDFEAFTLDLVDEVGFSQGGIYTPGDGLENATFDGWLADQFPDLQASIQGPGAVNFVYDPVDVESSIDLVDLPRFDSPWLGTVYGPTSTTTGASTTTNGADVTSAFAWALDPFATTATITTFLTLVADPPSSAIDFSGDWQSIRVEEGAHDRNVAVAAEWETGDVMFTGVNDVVEDAQFLGVVAPDEKSGDDIRRLGFEVHGSLNRPGDRDVFAFDADYGTEVWLDIDRTTHALDTVVELIDSSGNVLARSDNSGEEAEDPSLLNFDAAVMQEHEVNPLVKSVFDSRDLWTTNPRDAGMRVILPPPENATQIANTYHVRVRSSSPDLNDVEGGLTSGVYKLQVRLRETDEFPGTTVQMADIRYATNGIELIGMPAHSPLIGEAAEALIDTDNDGSFDADANDALVTADRLGNLLNTDRGALSVAGNIDTFDDVDWYTFEVRYDSIEDANSTALDPMHAAAVFDIDYADGFARANTNLWVYAEATDALGNTVFELVLAGRDSNVSEDRPGDTTANLDDLSRGSIGPLDPYIGTVELPAAGFAPGVYYVAVTSNAIIPDELEQFLVAAPAPGDTLDTLVRLEPVNSVERIAEDHVDSAGYYTTAETPQIPILFGQDDQVTLIAPSGGELVDGETFTITNREGNWVTYEFDLNATFAEGNVPIPYDIDYTDVQIAAGIRSAIELYPPSYTSPSSDPLQVDPPGIRSVLRLPEADLTGPGQVTLTEEITVRTVLNEIDLGGTEPWVTSRQKTHSVVPQVRQAPAPGEAHVAMQVSRPAVVPFDLSDVTLFVSHDPGYIDTTELWSVDPLTGERETRIGQFGARVDDIAMDPRGIRANIGNEGGIFGFSIPDDPATWTDATQGHYWQINPALNTPTSLGMDLGDDGIATYRADPMNPQTPILADNPYTNSKAGVGISFNAVTFTAPERQENRVHGFAVGNRMDSWETPPPNHRNILFEFSPDTGAAFSPPSTQDRSKLELFEDGGTQIRDRGTLNTRFDPFLSGGGGDSTINASPASSLGSANPPFNIFDGDVFGIDWDDDDIADETFEFDTGEEYLLNIVPDNQTNNVSDPIILRDGDTFSIGLVDPPDSMNPATPIEFDTGSVLVIDALIGAALADGGQIQITDDPSILVPPGDPPPRTPLTITFEFDNDNQFVNPGATNLIRIPFNNTDTRQAIINSIVNTINVISSANPQAWTVTAQQLDGTDRISFLNESPNSPTTAANTTGFRLSGDIGPNDSTAILVPIEETYDAVQIAWAVADAVDIAQPGFQAGAFDNRLNFMGATYEDTTAVSRVFTRTGSTGVGGTSNPAYPSVPFRADDDAVGIAGRIRGTLVNNGYSATQADSMVTLTGGEAFVCNAPTCPLGTGGVASGGDITGLAFVGTELYAVTDAGGLFRIGRLPYSFDWDYEDNRADYIDGSQSLLASMNGGQSVQFEGLTVGPQNTADGRYENMLFGIDDTGRIFAFDTQGRPQGVFADGAAFVDTGISGANGLAFGNLDDNLWHVTEKRTGDSGHGVVSSFDGSRVDEDGVLAVNNSFYFGYEGDQVQPQFGEDFYEPETQLGTYDFPGGSHGSMVSNPLNLEGYSEADKPTLYFNYFLETEDADSNRDATLPSDAIDRMTDAFRVYVSGDDGRWKLLATNNGDRDAATPDADYSDEFDLFNRTDHVTGERVPEQPFYRGELFDNTGGWRQARVDLSPYAGQDNLRLRFDFSTAGGMSTGGDSWSLDLAVAGNELRAIPGAELHDGQMFTVADAAFEFEMGPSIVAPTGAAITDGATFDVDGTVYEFDSNNVVNATNNFLHIAVPFDGSETAGQLAINIEQVLSQNPPPSILLTGDLFEQADDTNDTLAKAVDSGLVGTTQVFRGTGSIGDNPDIDDLELDVDMVKLRLDAGDSVTIETDISRLGTQLDPYLRLFDVSGNELHHNDNRDSTNPHVRDAWLQYRAPERGTYYVGISSNYNPDYPDIEGRAGFVDGVVTTGPYEFTITVTDSGGPQRVGNRLNLPNVGAITPNGLPASFVEGAGGVSASAEPVRVHAGMSNLTVADEIQFALADHFAAGSVEAFSRRHEVVQVVGHEIGDAGPLGLSGPSDPYTTEPQSGLFGDRFGAFGVGAPAVTDPIAGNVDEPGALAMQDNRHEGVYIDDIIIGFASRGEMVADGSPSGDPGFDANTAQTEKEEKEGILEIDEGAYQLEIRQATQYGRSDVSPDPTLTLYNTFDVNDRLAEGITLDVSAGDFFADGQTFDISDGQETVTFEFDDVTAGNSTTTGNVAIPFEPSDNDVTMALRVREAINRSAVAQVLDVTAVSADGIVAGTASTSNRVNLFGEVIITAGLVGNRPTGNLPVEESNDRFAIVEVAAGQQAGVEANQQLTVQLSEGITDGTFALYFMHDGRAYTSEDIPFDAMAIDVRLALEDLLRVVEDDLLEDLLENVNTVRVVGPVAVSGDAGGPWLVDWSNVFVEGRRASNANPFSVGFIEALEMTDIDPLSGDGSNLLLDRHRPVATGIVGGGREAFRAIGVIGDNPDVDDFGAEVDLYRVELNAGELLSIDIDATELGSPLDSFLRVFDVSGNIMPVESDDDRAPGEDSVLWPDLIPNLDSYIDFTAPADGVYYIGVSAFDNDEYDPTVVGSGRPGTTGHYEIDIERPANMSGLRIVEYEGSGDSNLTREQGQVIIHSNRITNTSQYGIRVEPGRSNTGVLKPGPARNLHQINAAGLVPGVTIVNNVMAYNKRGGVSFSGDPTGVGSAANQPAVVPFGRIINNTMYGGARENQERVDADIVFLIDTSGSMSSDIDAVRQQLGYFDSEMQAANIHARYGLVLFPEDASTTEPRQAVDITNFANFYDPNGVFRTFPTGGGFEQGSRAVLEALNGIVPTTTFSLRSGATPVLIMLTDEGDSNTVLDVPDHQPAVDALRSDDALFFGIVNPDVGNTQLVYGDFASQTGGRLFELSEFQRNRDPFFQSFTQTVVDVLTLPDVGGVGVVNNASPTVLNNIVAGHKTGISVDPSSSSTVVGGNVYQNNGVDNIEVVGEQHPVYLNSNDPLFLDALEGNFYLASGSAAIDSSVDSLEDRLEMMHLREPLGIASSPVLAPDYDANGLRRVDDPDTSPPPGMGENIFKDRGAVERSDTENPSVSLLMPLDNGSHDLDSTVSLVSLLHATLREFSLRLADGERRLRGIGIDDTTVTSDAVNVVQDSRLLMEGMDYRFDYDPTSNTIRLTSLSGLWSQESSYVIQFVQDDRFVIPGRAGDEISDGDLITITDVYGDDTPFEYDSGYVIDVRQTLAVQVPVGGGNFGGVADGDTITVDNTNTAASATIELDSDGVYAPGNIVVQFNATSSQGEIADAIAAALDTAGVGLKPVHGGNGYVHLGVNGNQTLSVLSSTLVGLGVPAGISDGETFTIDDRTKVVTFEFSEDSITATGNVRIPFSLSKTHEQIAQTISTEINEEDLGLNTRHLGGGRIHVGGSINHIIDLTQADQTLANLTLTGQPGARLPWGIQIPTEGGSFVGQVADGETFTITEGAGQSVTFELDDDLLWTPGNTPIPFSDTNSTWQLANAMVSRIRNSGLGLFPLNAGNGIVALGTVEGFALEVDNTALTEVGVSGLPAAVAVPFVPDFTFASNESADALANAINEQQLPGVSASLDYRGVAILGAQKVSGLDAVFVSSIKDLAGNAVLPNQADGETRFTVFFGAGMDYGDAPSPYPTLRSEDGARHQIISGFSLGDRVDINADGQPTPAANADDDEDGVVFETPLIPNRSFSFSVSTRGIRDDRSDPDWVVDFGVLDAWIDFNADGDWDDFNEHIVSNEILTEAALVNDSITFRDLIVPGAAAVGDTYARFRLSLAGGLSPDGDTDAGEIEDYRVNILSNPWQNSANVYDVNGSGAASPVDVLLMINWVNDLTKPTALPVPKPAGQPFLDVNGDGSITALDILQAINHINALNTQLGAGEGEAGTFSTLVVAAESSGEGEASLLNDLNGALIASADGLFGQPLRGVYETVPYHRADGADSRGTEVENQSDDGREYRSLARSSTHSSRAAATHRNHLEDILGPQESWLDIVEDVDQALGRADPHHAIFAELGV